MPPMIVSTMPAASARPPRSRSRRSPSAPEPRSFKPSISDLNVSTRSGFSFTGAPCSTTSGSTTSGSTTSGPTASGPTASVCDMASAPQVGSRQLLFDLVWRTDVADPAVQHDGRDVGDAENCSRELLDDQDRHALGSDLADDAVE